MKKLKSIRISLKKTLFSTKRRKIITLVILAIIVFSQVRKAYKPDFTNIDTYKVERSTFVENITASGEVKANKSINLVFQPSGEVAEVFVKDGDVLKTGDKIARLDSTILYQSYLQADANLRAAQAALDKTYDDVQGHETDETYAQISTRTAAEVNKDNAYRAYIAASKNLSNATVTAPFDGIINFNNSVTTGSYSSPLASNFTLVDPTSIYFDAEVSEIEVSKLTPDSKAKITLDAYPDETFDQNIEMISFSSVTTSTGGTAYKVKITMPENDKNRFRLGMNGDIEFIIKTDDNALSVPITAITEESGKEYVWKVNTNNRVQKVEVETGISSIDSIEILSGISDGDIVLTRPPSKIEDGNKIQAKQN